MLIDSLTLYFGKSWTGKTARMLHDLREEQRVVLCDPKCAQLETLKRWDHFWLDYNEEGNRWTDSAAPFFEYLAKRRESFFRVLLHFRYAHPQNLELVCQLFSSIKDCVIAADELALFIPPFPPKLPRWTGSVVISGTHDRIRFYGTAQRPSLVHPTVRGNATRMFLFRMTLPHDLEAMRAYLPESFCVQLSNLPDHTPICWADALPPFIDCSLAGKLKTLPGTR